MYQNSKHHPSAKNVSKKGNSNNDPLSKTLNSEKIGKKCVPSSPLNTVISEDKRIKLEAKRKLGGGGMNSPYFQTSASLSHHEEQQHVKAPGSSNFPSCQVKSSMNSNVSRQFKQHPNSNPHQQELKPLFSQIEFPALETCYSLSHPHSHSHSHSHPIESSSTLKKSSNNNSKTNSPKECGKLKENNRLKEGYDINNANFHNNENDEDQVTKNQAPTPPILDHWQMVYTACRKLFKDLDEEKDADRGEDCQCHSCTDQTNADRSKEETQNHEDETSNGDEKPEATEVETVEIETICLNQNQNFGIRDYDFEDWDLVCDSRNGARKEWQNSEDEDDSTLENNEDDNDEDGNACDYEWIIISDKQIQCGMSDEEAETECQQYNVF